jgi:hypothetical protein
MTDADPDTAARAILRRAQEKIAAGWTQGVLARDASGAETDAEKPEATCWCAIGAIAAARHELHPGVIDRTAEYRAGEILLASLNGGGDPDSMLSIWNDRPGRTQVDVLKAFERALTGGVL